MKFLGTILMVFLSLGLFAQMQVDKKIELTGATPSDKKIEGIEEVVNSHDAANKEYVDTSVASAVSSAGGAADCITLSTKTSPAGYVYTGYYQQFTQDPGVDYWSTKANMAISRSSHGSTVYNGRIYVFGGWYSSGGDRNRRSEYYDPATNTWTQIADLPSTNANFPTGQFGVATVNGKIYIIGGTSEEGSSCYTDGYVLEYDPATDTYTQKSNMGGGGRRNFGIATWGGKIYTMGGEGDCCGGCSTNRMFEYDPATDSWTRKADMPISVYANRAVAVNGKVYSITGANSPNNTRCYEYDIATNSWSQKADVPTGVYGVTLASQNDLIYVFGGYNSGTLTQIFDPAGNSWSTGGSMPQYRAYGSADALNGKIYLFGGVSSGLNYIYSRNQTWQYDADIDKGSYYYMHCKQ